MPGSALGSEDSVIMKQQRSLLKAYILVVAGWWQGEKAGDAKETDYKQISNEQTIYSTGFLSISYVSGRVLGGGVIKTNETKSLSLRAFQTGGRACRKKA